MDTDEVFRGVMTYRNLYYLLPYRYFVFTSVPPIEEVVACLSYALADNRLRANSPSEIMRGKFIGRISGTNFRLKTPTLGSTPPAAVAYGSFVEMPESIEIRVHVIPPLYMLAIALGSIVVGAPWAFPKIVAFLSSRLFEPLALAPLFIYVALMVVFISGARRVVEMLSSLLSTRGAGKNRMSSSS